MKDPQALLEHPHLTTLKGEQETALAAILQLPQISALLGQAVCLAIAPHRQAVAVVTLQIQNTRRFRPLFLIKWPTLGWLYRIAQLATVLPRRLPVGRLGMWNL